MNFARRPQLAAAVLLVALSGDAAWSQAARTIRVIVPYQPGGATDVLARVLAEQIGRTQGPTMLIENRPGASTIIGTEAASRAAPNGATVLITDPSFLLNPHLRKVNYDPVTSFEPICHLASSPLVITVNSASAYRTLADLFNAARGKPGDLTLAAAGPASILQVAFETLKRAAKVDMNFIPYPGGAPSIKRAAGRACDVGVHRLAIKSGEAACARHHIADAGRVATGSPNRFRDRLQGLRGGQLVRAVRAS